METTSNDIMLKQWRGLILALDESWTIYVREIQCLRKATTFLDQVNRDEPARSEKATDEIDSIICRSFNAMGTYKNFKSELQGMMDDEKSAFFPPEEDIIYLTQEHHLIRPYRLTPDGRERSEHQEKCDQRVAEIAAGVKHIILTPKYNEKGEYVGV